MAKVNYYKAESSSWAGQWKYFAAYRLTAPVRDYLAHNNQTKQNFYKVREDQLPNGVTILAHPEIAADDWKDARKNNQNWICG